MGKTVGYLITFTTYGTWLQGDPRGYVKNGQVLAGEEPLMYANRFSKRQDAVRLSARQRRLVADAIMAEAAHRQHKIHALSVRPAHVHVACGYTPMEIGNMVARYKNAARVALRDHGHQGRLWSKGYDKRFCFDVASLQQKIDYVRRHTK